MTSRIKALLPILLAILTAILITTSIVLAATTTRHTAITRIPDKPMAVSADAPLNLGEGITSGDVAYTVTNTAAISYTVHVDAVPTTGVSCSLDKDTFLLTAGQSTIVTATLTFTDLDYTSGDCYFTFSN